MSPHLSAYRFRITSTLSILHRMTGVALSAGTLLFAIWLISVASGAESYSSFASFIGSWLGAVIIAGFAFAFFYHLSNGIRHLFWDAGKGFEIEQAQASGWTVVAVSAIATVLTLLSIWV